MSAVVGEMMKNRWYSGAPVHVLHCFSTAAAAAAAAAVGGAASFCTYSLVYKISFFIFRLMRYTDICFFSLSGVLFPRE